MKPITQLGSARPAFRWQSRCGSVTFLNSGRAPNFTRNFFKDDVIDYNLGAVAICVCLRFSRLQNKAPATDPLNVEELCLQSTPDIFAQLGIESFLSRGCLRGWLRETSMLQSHAELVDSEVSTRSCIDGTIGRPQLKPLRLDNFIIVASNGAIKALVS